MSKQSSRGRHSGGDRLKSLASRAPTAAVLWIILTEGETGSWTLAILAIAAAAWVSVRTIPPGVVRLSARGVATFVPFFLAYSARGGVDVAARALRPSPRLDPGTIRFRTRLPAGPPRTFFVASIGLLPGTLTARLDGDDLRVHVLDRTVEIAPQLESLERRVAKLFRSPLSP